MKTNLKSVSRKERVNALQTARTYIPVGARLCPTHYNIDSWNAVSNNADICEFSGRQIDDMLKLALPDSEESNRTGEISNINIPSITGLTEVQFHDLFSQVPSLVRTMSSEKQARKALLMLLMRFRKAASYKYIGEHFGTCRSTATENIAKARSALTEDFVPRYLGFENLTRDLLLKNTTVCSRMLHSENDSEKLITIWDGTYIYINKSANYKFQKETFSGQKKRNFLRPMMCVTTNGYIIDVFGPFEAVKNDAKCMKTIFERNLAVNEKLEPGDVFILDRGFRDCLADIENRGYVAKTPEFIRSDHPTQQLANEQANRSRLVTKTRFVVEARNGHIKGIFPLFYKTWPTTSARHCGTELRIAAALINKYFKPIVADKGNEIATANAMLSDLPTPNIIQPVVIQESFQQTLRSFQMVEPNDFSFARLTEKELQQITQGSYQLCQAKSYAIAHKRAKISSGVDYLCFHCPTDTTQSFFGDVIDERNISRPVLIMTRMASRFMSNKSYDSYILADVNKNGPSAIIAYCCECKNGLRTVGCCSHVATTVYYLCYARHNGGIIPVAGHVDEFFVSNDLESSSEEED